MQKRVLALTRNHHHSATYPHEKLDILVFNLLNVAANGWCSGDDLVHKSIQDMSAMSSSDEGGVADREEGDRQLTVDTRW